MKKLLSLALVTLGLTVSAPARWVVFDPTMNVQSILNTAQEIAKYVQMPEYALCSHHRHGESTRQSQARPLVTPHARGNESWSALREGRVPIEKSPAKWQRGR